MFSVQGKQTRYARDIQSKSFEKWWAMKLGVCYYPEQWPHERWPEDARLMREAGLSLVRIAEFAWVAMEPKEGEFNWDWLDRAIDVLSAESLQVVLSTPTASPPPWLCQAYPDILPVDAQGRRRRCGSRRHYCPNSLTYHRHTERIVNAIASRYGNHPEVIGWQIDNEFGWFDTARCYCDTCASSFRRWLNAKYGTIDALNDAWGTIFWSQTYGDWSEIDPPNLTIAEPNPSHTLDYYRFSSDAYVTYQQLQISTLRLHISDRQFVTTNFMDRFSDLDYYDLASPLDFATMSSYPTGHAETRASLYMPSSVQPHFPYDVGDPYVTSLGHTLTRGFKYRRQFWIMEQQCGNVNWGAYNTGIRPGTVRLWTWHALASGAEAVLYFRWRAGLFAQEQHHSGLLHHDASPSVGMSDLEMMKAERSLMSEINQESHTAQIAFLMDYDSLWAVQFQRHHRDMDYMRHLFVYYRALQRLGLPADVVSVDADLSSYELVIVPTAFLAEERLALSLKSFAEAGGTVLLGVRSGFKTASNRVTEKSLPGHFRELLGITVSDWHSLPPGTSYELNSSIPGLFGPATVWAEALNIENLDSRPKHADHKILAHYASGPFSGSAAFVEHKVGTGRAYYLGWFPNDAQAETLLAYLASLSGIQPLAALPEGLIALQRGPHLILLNFTDTPLVATTQGRPIRVGARDVEVVHVSGF
jgi:beta-galactosidase